MKAIIVIPARFSSSRLPGKPLIELKGKTMLARVVEIAKAVSVPEHELSVVVATDDERIMRACEALSVEAVMTKASAPTGTDRVAETVALLGREVDFILNLQGDAPFTPPDFLEEMIRAYEKGSADMVTPVVRLSFTELDKLRKTKESTPFSGTTAVFNQETGLAYWFSKNIIPALRSEESLRTQESLSPVFRHIGLYGYARPMLEKYLMLAETPYEKLEGLEQLRLLEQGYRIRCVEVDYRGRPAMSGVDSPEDVQRAEALLA